MRGTVAKRIRRLVGKDFSNLPVKEYVVTTHKDKYVPTEQLTEQGKPKFFVVSPKEVTLSENCQRAISQYVKRNYNGNALYSAA